MVVKMIAIGEFAHAFGNRRAMTITNHGGFRASGVRVVLSLTVVIQLAVLVVSAARVFWCDSDCKYFSGTRYPHFLLNFALVCVRQAQN